MNITKLLMWSQECENAVNEQINHELNAYYSYLSISNYFKHKDIGLDKLCDYFYKCAQEEQEHAKKLMDYQNMRGGTVKLESLPQPYRMPDINRGHLAHDVLVAFKKALEMEQEIYGHLLNLHRVGESDPQFQDFIEGEFLKEQVEAIYGLEKYLSQLERIGDNGHGIIYWINHMD